MSGCKSFVTLVMTATIFSGAALYAQELPGVDGSKPINLATSKQMLPGVPGLPQKLNSLPLSLAVSPDGLWVVAINAGYGTYESHYWESLAVMDTTTGKITDFPDERMKPHASQTFFSGLAISKDGTKVYASVASVSDAAGLGKNAVGNGVAVFSLENGVLKPAAFFRLPLVKLAKGRTTQEGRGARRDLGVPYPAAITLTSKNKLLIAENLADAVVLMDAKSGKIEHTFDLSETDAVPSTYPIATAVTADGKRGFVALWNGSEVAELDLTTGHVVRKVTLLKPSSPTDPGTHPCALLLDEHSGLLYVALSNRDAVAAIDIGKGSATKLQVHGYFDTRLPGQTYFG
ncbi:MAG: phosphoesterase, partial [Bryocella sp.]